MTKKFVSKIINFNIEYKDKRTFQQSMKIRRIKSLEEILYGTKCFMKIDFYSVLLFFFE
jgi:hypothetical protein